MPTVVINWLIKKLSIPFLNILKEALQAFFNGQQVYYEQYILNLMWFKIDGWFKSYGDVN